MIMMTYKPLNLTDLKDIFKAEHVRHLEDGIMNVLPANPGAYQYPATDGDGKLVWADRLAYETTQNVVIQEDASVGAGTVTGAMPEYDDGGVLAATAIVLGDTYIVTCDGVNYTGVAQPAENGAGNEYPGFYLFGSSYNDFSYAPLRLYAYGPGVYVQYQVDKSHSLKITHVAKNVKPLDPQYLPPEAAKVGEISWNDLTDKPFYVESETLYEDYLDIKFFSATVPGVVLREGVNYKAALIYPDKEIALASYHTAARDDLGRIAIKYDDAERGFELYMGNDGGCYFRPIGTMWEEGLPETSEMGDFAYTTKYIFRIGYANSDDAGVKTIDPKFLRTVVKIDMLTKAQAIEYAKTMANVAGLKSGTFYPLLGYSILASSAGDECSGCGSQSATLRLTGNGNYNLESFDITDDEYNQIASAWGLS